MKRITFLILAVCVSFFSYGQIIIKGTVANDSIPLESANIINKNSTKGTITNSKGQFELKAKKGDTLSVSYIGYETKEIVVSKKENLTVQLEVGNNLEEVVVLAYGTTTRSYSKGCCCWVKTEVIEASISNKVKFLKYKLYPNPSSNGIFQIKLVENYNKVKISVSNLSGQTIQKKDYEKFGNKLSIDLSEFSLGIYIVNIVADGQYLGTVKAIKN